MAKKKKSSPPKDSPHKPSKKRSKLFPSAQDQELNKVVEEVKNLDLSEKEIEPEEKIRVLVSAVNYTTTKILQLEKQVSHLQTKMTKCQGQLNTVQTFSGYLKKTNLMRQLIKMVDTLSKKKKEKKRRYQKAARMKKIIHCD